MRKGAFGQEGKRGAVQCEGQTMEVVAEGLRVGASQEEESSDTVQNMGLDSMCADSDSATVG